jgi:signal transduction histidine kinase
LYRDIISLAEDQEGNLWVGTAGGGLNRIRTRAVTLESEEAGSPIAEVQSLSEGADGRLWATTRNGLLVYRTAGGWNSISNSIGGLACVAVDRTGRLWVGTRNHQLYHWQDGTFTSWGRTQDSRGQVLHCLLAAADGDLWVGGAPGFLQRLRPEQIKPFELPSDAGAVRTMIEDRMTNIWIGTARGTLLRVSGDAATDETERLGLQRMSIRTLLATGDGSVWIGYAGWGLGRLKEGHLSRITAGQGLYDDFVSQIVDDRQGWLWCAGDHGIFKMRLETLEDVFAGRQARVQSIHYGAEEGLPSLQAAFGVSPGALRTRDGRLWLPMRTGLAVVDPTRLPRMLQAPSVILNRVKVDNLTVGWYGGILPPPGAGAEKVVDLQAQGSKLRLGPAFRRLEFEFTAPSLAAPDNVHFRYRLAGYEDDWTETGERGARYSRLPANDYRFEVTSCNADGVWSPIRTLVELSVAPFVWQTWWFRLTALAAFTAAVVGTGRYVSFRRLRARLRGLEQQAALHKERSRIARDIHDDLGTRLSEITLLSELALRKPADSEQPGEHVRQIASTVRQVTDSLDEIVWAINPRHDTLPEVISYIGQFALRFLEMANIRCHLDLPDQPPKRGLSAEVRHNLFLVAKEALNNVVRHAQANEVWFSITVGDGSMNMIVKDNGRGFAAPPDDANADGLRNMRQRMSEIGGECHIQSQPGAGTQVLCSYGFIAPTENINPPVARRPENR